MALPDVASSRQPSPCPVSSSRETFFRRSFRMDGSLSGHYVHRTYVSGSRVLGSYRGRLPTAWRDPRSLRVGSLCRHVQPCPCAAVAKSLAIAAAAVRSEERRVGKEGRSRWSPYH